ncbi:Hypothetical protein A7982_08191 [Minicystis rosea]|nr:Hypothetical protein A7982_08191 [Minicystis rosea]
MIPALLALLAVLDAVFAGFRAAAGRNGRIDKWAYYQRAMMSAALAGGGVVLALAALTGAALLVAPDPAALYADLLVIGARMLWVFLGYTVMVLAALVVYAVASYELRTLATVTLLGPFTLLRPAVVAAATAWGIAAGRSAPATSLTIASSCAVLLLGWLLDRWYGRTQPV